MSLYGALYSGVSGLSSESSAMGAIADNITNVNTVGYKGTDVNFQTLVTQQVSLTQYSPGGVQSKPRAGIDIQGLLQATNSSTDVALSGQGFFVVNSVANPATEGGQFAYTRAGSFVANQNGYLENSSGFFVQGWPLTPSDNSPASVPSEQTINGTTYMAAYKNADGTFHYINQNIVSDTELQPLNVNDIGGTAQATSDISVGLNLPSGDPIYDPNHPTLGGVHDSNVLVYDSLGDSGNAQFSWTKIGANAWQLGVTPPAGAAVANIANVTKANGTQYYASTGQLEFNSIPPLGSYFTMNSTVPALPPASGTVSETVQFQFYNSTSSGTNAADPTTDTPTGTPPTSILGIDLNGAESVGDVTNAIQTAITNAANSPATKNTYNISNMLLGGVSNGATRFVANAGVLTINQIPGATAVNVNAISNATTGLGTSIVESGTGIGSGATTTGASPTAGQFTVQAIAPAYIQSVQTSTTDAFTATTVTGQTGTSNLTITANPPTGNFTIGNVVIPWSQIVAGVNAANSINNETPAFPNTPATTTGQIAANLAAAITAAAKQTGAPTNPLPAGTSAAVIGSTVVISSPSALTYQADTVANEITLANGSDGLNTFTLTPSVTGSNSFSITATPPAGSINIQGTSVTWATIEAGGGAYPNTGPGLTTAQLAANVAHWVDAVAGISGLTASSSSNSVTLTTSGPALGVTLGSTAAQTTWSNGTDGKVSENVDIASEGNLQVGNIQIPWSEIIAGKISTYFNTSSATPTVPVSVGPFTLTNGTQGTSGIPLGQTDTKFLAANAAGALTQLIGAGVLPATMSAQQDVTDTSSVDVTEGSTPISVFANEGGPANVITWPDPTNSATPLDASQAANAQVIGPSSTYSLSTGAAITFNGDGTPSSIIPTTMQLDWANGAENQDVATGSAGLTPHKPQITLNFGSLNQSDGVTQLGGDYSVGFLNQDGAKFGNFTGVSIGTNGIVTALFDNGVKAPVFQIPIATFANPDGMNALTGNVWIDTTDSGAYTLRVPGEAGSGTVQESSLEASTVDLGTEFTQMITVQRAYSAAAKVITTADQMLSDLINIIPG
jgi:flagellar hook protein FlgE